jgi:hypothetical protein
MHFLLNDIVGVLVSSAVVVNVAVVVVVTVVVGVK